MEYILYFDFGRNYVLLSYMTWIERVVLYLCCEAELLLVLPHCSLYFMSDYAVDPGGNDESDRSDTTRQFFETCRPQSYFNVHNAWKSSSTLSDLSWRLNRHCLLIQSSWANPQLINTRKKYPVCASIHTVLLKAFRCVLCAVCCVSLLLQSTCMGWPGESGSRTLDYSQWIILRRSGKTPFDVVTGDGITK